MNNKGFTLVELLAVIVILAIVLAIAIPSISNIINNSEKSSFVSSTKLLIKAVQIKLLEDETFDITTINKSNMKTLLNISGDNYSSVSFRYDNNGKIYANIEGADKWSNYVSCGNYENISISDCIIKEGLVSYIDAGNNESYPGSGTNWYDLSGTGTNCTLANGPTYDSNNMGSIYFDAVDDIVRCGNSANLRITDKITIMGFVKPNSDNINVSPIACKWSGTANQRAYYFGFSNKKAWFALSSNGLGGYPTVTSNTSLINNNWYHIAVTWDKSIGDMNIYINGVFDAKTANVKNSIFDSNRQYSIGSEDAGYAPTTRRNISVVQLYNRALSESEIKNNFNAMRQRYGL